MLTPYKHISVYSRMKEIWSYERKDLFHKHEKGNVDFIKGIWTSKPAQMYRLLKIRRKRVGQMELFRKVRCYRKKLKRQHFQKIY